MCWLIAAYTDCCTLTALFSCTCPFQYAHNVESHWCLHPENEPNLIYFCDWKICRLYPQSPRHIITITRSESLYLIWGICQCHVTNILNSDCCTHWLTAAHADWLLHTLTDCCTRWLTALLKVEWAILLSVILLILLYLTCFLDEYDASHFTGLWPLSWYPQIHCQRGRLSVCTVYDGQNNSFTTCTCLPNIEGCTLPNSSLHNCVSFVSSGCSRRVICLRQTSICFRCVFCWIC